MKRKWIRIIAVPLMAAGMLLAQSTPQTGNKGNFAQRRLDMLATVLNLTDAQKTQAQQIFTQSQQSAKPLYDQLKQNHTAMTDAVKANNTTQIQQLAAQQGTLMGQLAAIHATGMAQFYKLLTPEQQSKADQLHNLFAGGFRGGRFGPRH